jgi:hypothetical protein
MIVIESFRRGAQWKLESYQRKLEKLPVETPLRVEIWRAHGLLRS